MCYGYQGDVMARRYNKKQPTLKQIKAIKYINQGMSAYKAMQKAGYSQETSMKPSQNLFNKRGVQSLILTMGHEMAAEGLTSKYMVAKFKEWMEAQKIHTSHTEPDREVPDYDVQIRAYDRWEKVMTRGQEQMGLGTVKRKITLEEFITGEEEKVDA